MNSNQIKIYSPSEIQQIRKACILARDVLTYIEPYLSSTPDITTGDLNDLCHAFIIKNNAIPAPLNYNGFPKSICTSVNHVVCHGIPDNYKIKSGDIINIDVTVILDGWFGDTSKTYTIGKTTKLADKLVEVAKKALDVGILAAGVPNSRFGDVGYAIQTYVENRGFSVVRDYCGHGIGMTFHEEPVVLHYGTPNTGELIRPGMVFTIEPMVNAGSYKTKVLNDGWTAVTIDKSLSAQFEHTIAITESEGAIVLTK